MSTCWLFQPFSPTQGGRNTGGPRSQVWSGIYSVNLVEGQDMPDTGQGDIYVRFKVGDQRVKSKVRSSAASFFLHLL